MSDSKSVSMLVIYRIKEGTEGEFLPLLEKHYPTLDRLGLVTKEPVTIWRATDKQNRTYFVEKFSWRDGAAAGVAHQTPEVMAVWEPMGPMLENLELLQIEPVDSGGGDR